MFQESWEFDFAQLERAEEKWEASCLHADCGDLVAPDERYFECNGETYCMDCAKSLAEYCYDEIDDPVCAYCGETIDTDYEFLTFGGEYYHEDCWTEYINEESECFWGW